MNIVLHIIAYLALLVNLKTKKIKKSKKPLTKGRGYGTIYENFIEYPFYAVRKVTRKRLPKEQNSQESEREETNRAGNSGEARKGAEGARRKPNLSGKRTEKAITRPRWGYCVFFSGAAVWLFLFFCA